MSISKPDIARRVAETAGITISAAEKSVSATFDAIAAALASGNDVRLHGFGQFLVKDTKARTARNPMTGESVDVPAGRKVAFKPASELKKAV